jgi:hypothetical protein
MQSVGYKDLALAKIGDIKQTEEEIQFFKEMYVRETLSDRDSSHTYNIILDLERKLEDEKIEYHRLKTTADSSKRA